MNNNKKEISELTNLLKWQIDMGADAMIEKKNNFFSNNETTFKAKNLEEKYNVDTTLEIKSNDRQNKKNINENYFNIIKGCSNLEMLKEVMKNFEECDLKKTATQLVFADGNPASKIMLIGEAPGAEEDRQGRPFCGASGQLLDKMLSSIDLDRNTVYITNVIPWRPPGNRTPTEYEINLMKPFLMRHIEIVSPKIIVAVGGSSAKAVLNIEGGILRHRGLWKDLELGNGNKIPTIPTLHPAYLMRAPNQKKLAWEDLKSIRSKLQNL